MRSLLWLSVLVGSGCGEVVAPACSVAADCTDPAPFCIDSHCEANCSVMADCTDPDRGICASDGACVGCQDSADCTGVDAPICDTSDRTCRGCAADTECTGGVCIEAEGGCVADSAVAFVADLGNDTGTCTRSTPCATLTFALTRSKRVIHVLGGTLGADNVIVSGDHVLDGEDTALGSGSATALLVQAPPTNVIVEGFRFTVPTGASMLPAVSVVGFGTRAILDSVEIGGNGGVALLANNSADVLLSRSHVGTLTSSGATTVNCTNAKIHVDQSTLEQAIITDAQTQCEATVTRNRFESPRDGSVQIRGGQLVMENNLVIHRDGFNDSISVSNLRPGSTIRFNTLINTTALSSDGAALSCDNTVDVTSNVFAYNSGHPITGLGCATRFSVFDDVSTTAAGTGNQVTGIEQIFVDRGAGNFHLSATSVAREGAEPGQTMVKDDFEGQPRPNPAGTTSDCGAFEAP